MILLRCLFAIPHYIVLWLISLPLAIGGTIALTLISRALSPVVGPWTLLLAFFPIYAFIILAMGRLPEWLYRYLVGLTRWQYNINTYVLFHNAYPPFTWEDGAYSRLSFDVEEQGELNRWLPFVKWFAAIPHFIALLVLFIAAFFVYVFVWFAVLLTGRYPRGAFDFLIGVARWNARVTAYALLLVDEYPPFSLVPTSPPAGGRPAPSAESAERPAEDPASRLRELRSLLNDGILTEEEYEERRRRLVEEL